MKKKGLFSKISAIILVFCLILTMCPIFSAFASQTNTSFSSEDELWHQEFNQKDYNYEGDLSLDELKTAELAPEDTPEIVTEENIQKNDHVNRLWEQEEDLNTIIFQNRNGTKTSYHFSNPVKYTDKNGKIKDKSNKISEVSNGDYTNAENDINAYFPKKVHKNKGVELRFGEYVIEMAPNINGSSGACRQTGHNKYSDPTEYVQYPDVFDDGISLRYTPTFDGYKEDIILNEKPKQNEFEFKLTTNGLSVVQASIGNYYLTEPSTGEYVTALGDIVIYDNNGNESDGYNHYYEVTPITENEQYLITIVVDELYLESENTVYPVYVDPTLTALSQGFVEDATLYSNKTETAYDSGLIKIGYTTSYGISRGLYNFPLSYFEDAFLLMYGNQIVSAELNLYAVGYSEANDKYNVAKTLSLYEFNNEWSSYTVNWNNTDADDYGDKICSVEVTKHWTAFDIKEIIDIFKTNPDYTTNFKGLLLKAEDETVGTWKKIVSSSGTAANRPYITITYNDNPPACQQIVSGNIFYIKNRYDDCLNVYNSNTTNNTPLLIYGYTGNTNQQFKITNVTGGEYIISPMHTTGKVVSATADGDIVIEDNQNLWRQRWFIYYRNGKYHIVNKKYRTGVMAPTTASDYVTINNEYSACCWELEEIDYSVRPQQITLSHTNVTAIIGDTFSLNATVLPDNTSQTVIWSSSNSYIATVSEQGLVYTLGAGTVTITARSKLDNTICATCVVIVRSRYQYELVNLFEFSEEEAQLIISVYERIDNIYSSESRLERAWRCARLFSEFCDDYDSDIRWDDVAGDVTDPDTIESYFTDTLGFTQQQYATLRTALTAQHSDVNTNDFCHLQYSLAARLAYRLDFTGDLSNLGTLLATKNIAIYSDEEISYLAGWLGDAILTNMSNGTTSFGNDDYMADLDAENIYRNILKGYSSIEGISAYYSSLSTENNRAHIFTSYISYETACDLVFYELIDAPLLSLISANSQDAVISGYYTNLLNDEEYHWNTLKEQYYDTYNFLNSLRDLSAYICEY